MGKQRSSKDTDGLRNTRIDSEILHDRNSLIISQNFCVNAVVGGVPNLVIEEVVISEDEQLFLTDDSSNFEETPKETVPIQQDYTLIYAAPAEPMRTPLLITVIAKNLSVNDVLVSIEDEQVALVEEVVPAKSELALTAQNAFFIRALALAPSHVQFYISVFHPTNPF